MIGCVAGHGVELAAGTDPLPRHSAGRDPLRSGRYECLDLHLHVWKDNPTEDCVVAVGCSTADEGGLRFIYENDEHFAPLPTFGVLLAQEALGQSGFLTGGMPGFNIDLTKVGFFCHWIEMAAKILPSFPGKWNLCPILGVCSMGNVCSILDESSFTKWTLVFTFNTWFMFNA